ncbi:MAG: M23 family metallopeptidase [Dehalococcoidia bacterium]|nr:M23 family metallopeptidase [Dehalococcoidia bacterium]
MLTRRRFIAGASGVVVLGTLGRSRVRLALGEGGSPAGTPVRAAESGLPYRLLAPNISNDGLFPTISVSQFSPYQGGAILVSAINAVAGSAHVFGRQYTLAMGPEGLSGFVGFGTEDPAGPARLSVHVVGTLEEQLDYSYDLTVRKTQWTFDDIYLPPAPPPDPNAPPPPPPPPDETQRLKDLYAIVTTRQWEGSWQIPLELGGDVWVSGYFGEERSFNGGPRCGHHGGTDIAAPAGTPIRATNRGIVVFAEEGLYRGNLVVIDHGAGVLSSYGHQSALRVTVGDTVERGDVVGLVGSTGLSSGPHLHWEMAVGGVLVDGLRWLDGTQGF